MVRIKDVNFKLLGKDYNIHGGLSELLIRAKNEIKKDDDIVILVVGPEGVGKSKLRDLIGGFWEHITGVKFTIDNIHFTTTEYMKFALKQPPFTFISHDEARRDLNTKRSMAKIAVNFTNYMSECRDNNQIHCLILPAFSDIDKYIALWRVKMIIEVGKKKNSKSGEYERGLFRIIKTVSKKKLAYFHQNKYSKFPRSMVAFTGTFKDNDIIDKDVYKKKKQQFKEVKYIEEEKEEQIVLTPRQIEVIGKIQPYSLFKDSPKDQEILRKLVYSLRKVGSGESG
jgi:energy-coupling factor transporter ATP-binding protein EcfA2